jgi:hypothetical protein
VRGVYQYRVLVQRLCSDNSHVYLR